jgi:excisionase family DNA binding protein
MDQLFTIKKAAEKLAVSPEFLKRLCRQGRLHAVRLGRVIRVSEQELDRLCHEEFQEAGFR